MESNLGFESETDISSVSDGRLTADNDVTTICYPSITTGGFNDGNDESTFKTSDPGIITINEPNSESNDSIDAITFQDGDSGVQVSELTGPNNDYDDNNDFPTFQNGDLGVSISELSEPNNDFNASIDDFTAPDGGWGWMVTIASFMHNFLLDGVIYTFGIFFDDFLEYFGDSKGKTQMLSSVISGTYLLIGPLVGVAAGRFQCRKVAVVGAVVASLGLFLSTFSPNLDVMILLYGIIGGIGFGLVYEPSILMVSYYFKKRRALATGIALCGSGLGGFVFAPLNVILLDVYGWKGAIWILSAIVLNSAVFAGAYRPLKAQRESIRPQTVSPVQNGNTNNVKSVCTSLSQHLGIAMLKSPSVVVYLLSSFLVAAGFYIPLNFLPSFARELNLTASEGALLISIIGIFNTIVRVVIGVVSDRPWADCILINGISLVIGGVATFFVPYFTLFGVLAVYSIIFGSVIGIFVSLKSIILIELKGIQKLLTGFALQCLILGISVLMGSPIAGFLSDMTGDFNIAFYLSGLTIALGGGLCLSLRRIIRWEKRNH